MREGFSLSSAPRRSSKPYWKTWRRTWTRRSILHAQACRWKI